jgi:pimeloyl-ACP methyl ester carboxylesterase
MSCEGASRLLALSLAGPAGLLEALLQECDSGSPAFAALVCHPHPLHGGSMDNKVVHRVAATLHELDGTTLRFNFRGVGNSAGHFDHGAGELEDARAALAWLRARLPGTALLVAGFSFGAWVAARLAASEPAVTDRAGPQAGHPGDGRRDLSAVRAGARVRDLGLALPPGEGRRRNPLLRPAAGRAGEGPARRIAGVVVERVRCRGPRSGDPLRWEWAEPWHCDGAPRARVSSAKLLVEPGVAGRAARGG